MFYKKLISYFLCLIELDNGKESKGLLYIEEGPVKRVSIKGFRKIE